jgi:putative phosphoesterase
VARAQLTRVGLISDTHGLLRPEAIAFLRGCDCIVHGGDIGNATVLAELSALGPLTAVRGNNDSGAWARTLPHSNELRVEDILVHVVHDIADLNVDCGDFRVVVSGHSHKPAIDDRDGVLFVNPGSAGPRRFKLPISVGELVVDGSRVSARVVALRG